MKTKMKAPKNKLDKSAQVDSEKKSNELEKRLQDAENAVEEGLEYVPTVRKDGSDDSLWKYRQAMVGWSISRDNLKNQKQSSEFSSESKELLEKVQDYRKRQGDAAASEKPESEKVKKQATRLRTASILVGIGGALFCSVLFIAYLALLKIGKTDSSELLYPCCIAVGLLIFCIASCSLMALAKNKEAEWKRLAETEKEIIQRAFYGMGMEEGGKKLPPLNVAIDMILKHYEKSWEDRKDSEPSLEKCHALIKTLKAEEQNRRKRAVSDFNHTFISVATGKLMVPLISLAAVFSGVLVAIGKRSIR